ncbi:MAG: RdgB/HAM1 family non-canonical purine NTP pyrophosphatase [Clostridia bacterium]|nr:RdgB/HAM1 family non-canonical purine NTP pyrophosphatase [Clostridia bacterium]
MEKTKKKILIASANAHKIKEIAQILPDYEVLGYKTLADVEIEETGTTFEENAVIKAKTVWQTLKIPALADDSGICVNALGGAPGVYSARYAGDGDDEHNNDLLLKNLQGETDRSAKYVCCMAYCSEKGDVLCATGETKGRILCERVGKNGFGYDSIFYSEELDKPMGLASAAEKNSVSHRARALKEIITKIKEYEKTGEK